jgi:hypothetical protein
VAGCGGFALVWLLALVVVLISSTNGNKNIPPGVYIAAVCIGFFAWVIWAISTHARRTSNDEKLKESWPAAENIWRNDAYYCREHDIFFLGSDPEMSAPREMRVKLLLAAIQRH